MYNDEQNLYHYTYRKDGTEPGQRYDAKQPTVDEQLLEGCRSGGNRETAVRGLCRYLQSQAPILPICFKTVSTLYESDVLEGLTPTAAEPFYGLENISIHLRAN